MSYEPSDAKSLFLQAVELTDSQQRRDFLDRVCRGNAELRRRVEQLLESHDDPGSLLRQPVLAEWQAPPRGDGGSASHAATGEHRVTRDPTQPIPGVTLDFLEPCTTAGRIGKLGQYEIIELVGYGGMGLVLKAFDTKLQRIVAIKLLSPTLAHNATAVKRFLREARAAAAVSHDHVVTIFAVEETSSPPYLVMEYIAGQSLQQKIDRCGLLDIAEILRIGMQIAEGLAAAHKQGLVHRDIKPANVLLENGVERVKITDFGLARAVDDVTMTQTGHVTGTPEYMSPEQAKGESLDGRSDLFSLGSVLYTMCTGRPAFRADSAIAVLRRVCDDQPRPISEINPEIPAGLIAIIDKLLAKQPQERFQSVDEVAELLGDYLAWWQQPAGHAAPRIPETTAESGSKLAVGLMALAIMGFALLAAAVIVGIFRWRPEIFSALRRRPKAASRVSRETVPSGPPPADVPFDPQQASKHQDAWAEHAGVAVDYQDPLGIRFRLIPPGTFQMGRAAEGVNMLLRQLEHDEASEFEKFSVRSSMPRHTVRVTQPFYLSAHEITVAQFRTFVDATGYRSTLEDVKSPPFVWRAMLSFTEPDRLPVMGVSWEDAKAFCRWLSKRHNVTYDLPSEAQWEFACRAGSEGIWSCGQDTIHLAEHAVFGLGAEAASLPVASRQPNEFELFDMHGNADEWCLDWHKTEFYAHSPVDDPVCLESPSDPASGRVVRGGAWNSPAWSTQTANRSYDFPGLPVRWHGFRIAIVGDLKATLAAEEPVQK